MKKLVIFLIVLCSVFGTVFGADEIHVDYDSGATVYAARFLEIGGNVLVTAGTSNEAWVTADLYDVTMTENGVGGHFVGSFDAGANIGDGTYKITVYEQLGGSPANGERAIYVGEIKWKDGAEDRSASASDSATTDALITSSHSTTDGKIDTTDALVTSSHSTTDGKIDTTDALVTSSHSTTDGKIDTTDALITSSHSTTDGKIDTTDALVTSLHSTTDGLIITVDGVVDSILTLATFMRDVMEGDLWTNTATTPWRSEVRSKGTASALIEKELFEVDGDDIVAVTQRIGQQTEPSP